MASVCRPLQPVATKRDGNKGQKIEKIKMIPEVGNIEIEKY